MNRIRKLAVQMVAILLLLAALPSAGLADSYKTETLKLNQWYHLRNYLDATTIYKLKVAGDTVVVFNWKNINREDDLAEIGIYRDNRCKDSIEYIALGKARSGSNGLLLYSGTYYISMSDEYRQGQVKASTKKAVTINKPNYCMGRAITVKAGKKVEIAQTKNDNYYRWYRIKLPKTQSITFSGLSEYTFTLYDRNLNEISCSDRGNVCVTQGLQPKGTYYLEVNRAYLSELAQKGEYTAFSWK